MEFIHLLSVIIGAIVVPFMLYVLKRLHSMQSKLNEMLSKKDIEHLIDLKHLPTEVVQRETAQDIKEIKIKLDRLTERLLDSKNK